MGITVTKDNFDQEVLKAEMPVLVDFWAEWCTPCKLQNPILEEVLKELGDRAKVAKVNVDEQPELGEQYNVMSIPTLKLFHKGQVISEMIGLQSKERLLSELKKVST